MMMMSRFWSIDAQNLQRRVAECVCVRVRVFLIYCDAQTGSAVSALRLGLMPPGLPSQFGASQSAANTHIPAWRVYPLLFIYLAPTTSHHVAESAPSRQMWRTGAAVT